MAQLLILVAVAAVAVAVALVLRRRQSAEPARGPSWTVPTLLDRADFERPDAPWLVAVFSSATCLACADTWDKAALLESDAVAVQELEATARRDLHDRYGIDAVPLVLVADAAGVVRRHFVGPPTATDLWAALAELREPGTVPPQCTHDG
jgi:hypothetical protein